MREKVLYFPVVLEDFVGQVLDYLIGVPHLPVHFH